MQGKVKTKVQVPGRKDRNKQKHVHQKKSTIKKGRVKAPKKAKHIQLAKLKKSIEKAIGSNIEHEIVSRANATEPRSLQVVTTPSSSKDTKKNKKK